jgi:FkbM family methyltransferase
MENKKNSVLSNLSKGVAVRLSQLSKAFYLNNLGLNIIDIKVLKHLSDSEKERALKLKFGTVYYFSAQNLYHSLIEIFEDQIYAQQLAENSYIVDCGGNIGLSAIFLKGLCPSAEIDVFEPDPDNFQLLTKNVMSCNLSRVNLHNKAVWNENTTLNFQQSGSLSSHVNQSATTEGINVQAVSLREFLIRPVDFLKIDIEGAEFLVLKDIKEHLHFIKAMFLEYHGKFEQNHELMEMLDIVVKSGFRFYIREAAPVFRTPFSRTIERDVPLYDIQLNIFCFRV